jgi:hypothetical protein
LERNFLNRSEAVEVLKGFLEIGNICYPMYSLDVIRYSTNYKVSIWVNDQDRLKIRRLALSIGLIIDEEMGTLVIS